MNTGFRKTSGKFTRTFFFKISRYMIERCMIDEQEESKEEIYKYTNIFI